MPTFPHDIVARYPAVINDSVAAAAADLKEIFVLHRPSSFDERDFLMARKVFMTRSQADGFLNADLAVAWERFIAALEIAQSIKSTGLRLLFSKAIVSDPTYIEDGAVMGRDYSAIKYALASPTHKDYNTLANIPGLSPLSKSVFSLLAYPKQYNVAPPYKTLAQLQAIAPLPYQSLVDVTALDPLPSIADALMEAANTLLASADLSSMAKERIATLDDVDDTPTLESMIDNGVTELLGFAKTMGNRLRHPPRSRAAFAASTLRTMKPANQSDADWLAEVLAQFQQP